MVNYEIINGIVISPKSFLDAKSVEFYYNSHKKFMYELLKPTNDEFALFNKLSRNDAELMMDIKCNKLTDIQVCKIIDDYVSEHNDVLSFIHLSNMQKDYIRNILNSLGVYPNQVKRCWM